MTQKNTFFDVCNYIFLGLFSFVALYPIYYVIINSISDPLTVMQNKVNFFPSGINFEAYVEVFNNKAIINSYGNTIFYTVVGTFINVILTIFGAFPLSRKQFIYRNFFMILITFTLFFNGGLIPTFIVVDAFGLTDTRWALIFPTAVNAFNLIIMRSFFDNLPLELEESVKIDGGTDLTVLWRIFIPLSKPVIAVITLFYVVFHWNNYFNALIYLRDSSLFPLQLVLREILLMTQTQDMLGSAELDTLKFSRVLQYASIVVSIIPMLVFYPFLQKYFVKGMLIGAIKG